MAHLLAAVSAPCKKTLPMQLQGGTSSSEHYCQNHKAANYPRIVADHAVEAGHYYPKSQMLWAPLNREGRA